MMEDDKEPVYASKAKPWLKYYDEKYIHQSVPECSAFALVCRNNERHLGDTALEYYGRKFSYADLIVQIKKTAAALQALGVKKGRYHHGGQRDDPGGGLHLLRRRPAGRYPESGRPPVQCRGHPGVHRGGGVPPAHLPERGVPPAAIRPQSAPAWSGWWCSAPPTVCRWPKPWATS